MYKVYWTEFKDPKSKDFVDLSDALAFSAVLRNLGYRFVTMVSENSNCTSKLGVDEVTDIANYDGWISRGRAP